MSESKPQTNRIRATSIQPEPWEGSMADMDRILSATQPTAVDDAGDAYIEAAKKFAATAEKLRKHAGTLANVWKGKDADAAQKQMQRLHATSREMDYKATQTGTALKGHAEKLEWYKEKRPQEGFLSGIDVGDVASFAFGGLTGLGAKRLFVGSEEDNAAREHMNRLQQRTVEANNYMPNDLTTDLPDPGGSRFERPPGENNPPGGGGRYPGGGGGPNLPKDPFGSGDRLPQDPFGSGDGTNPPRDPFGPGGGPDVPSDPFGPGGSGSGSGTDLAGFNPGGGGGGGGLGGDPFGRGGLGGGAGGGLPAGGGPSAGGMGGLSGGPLGAGGGMGAGGAAGAGAGRGAAAGRGMGMGMGGAPMGGGGGKGGGEDHERSTWLTEDEDVWGGDDGDTAPPVIG
jgi:hypothetical protein